jgi:hypothetical protein
LETVHKSTEEEKIKLNSIRHHKDMGILLNRIPSANKTEQRAKKTSAQIEDSPCREDTILNLGYSPLTS